MNKSLHILSATFLILILVAAFWRFSPSSGPEKTTGLSSSAAVSNDKTAFWNYYHQAEQARQDKQFTKALELYALARQIDSTHEGILYHLGNIHLFQRDFEQARKLWQKLVQLNPVSVPAQKQLGTLYFCKVPENQLYSPVKAREHFLNVLELNRIETYSHLQLAKIAITEDRITRAEQYLSNVINQDFMNYQALFLKGYIHWQQGKRGASASYLAKADSVYQNINSVTMPGEGATEAGFKPMLAEEMYCDVMGIEIDSLLAGQKPSQNSDLFVEFEKFIK